MHRRREDTIAQERWRVRLFKKGAQIDSSPNLRSREAAEQWARGNPRANGLDVELWCRPAGASRFERTAYGWSVE